MRAITNILPNLDEKIFILNSIMIKQNVYVINIVFNG